MDIAALQIAFVIIYWLRYSSGLFPPLSQAEASALSSYALPDAILTACWLGIFTLFRFYRHEPAKWLFEEVTKVISATSLGMLILVIFLVDFTDPLAEMRYSVFIYWGVILALLVANRIYYFRYHRSDEHAWDDDYHRMLMTQRRVLLIFLDLAAIVIAYAGSFFLRFGGSIPRTEMGLMTNTIFLVMVVRFAMFAYFKVYAGLYRYASINDLLQILKAATAGSVLLVIPVYFFSIPLFPRSVFVIEWLLLVFLAGGLRFGLRAVREIVPAMLRSGKRTLIVGAGDAGEMIARELRGAKDHGYQLIGFIDDDPTKKGMRIHGIPVLGDQAEIEPIVEKRHIEEMIIAIPSASSGQMRSIVERCRNAKVSFKTVPPLIDILNARVSMREVRGIRVDDLLGREPVHLDDNLIRSFVSGKRVLVTGAAGSIGSEICRQTARYNPDILIMLDRAENELYKLDIEIRSRFPEANRATEITDIRDSNKLDLLMSKTRPDVVFHAAAYKQVPLMEFFPEEAVMNNIIGTKTVAECAIRNRVSSFVMISTDKAVRPSSVMGASKRIAEMLVTSLSRTSDTKFVTVRFGNVLGSHGSVVELFTYQIEHSGPVTVTHPQVTRYFMTIKEATLLVMMAGAIGRNGQLMVLKMGEQVKIVDLARDMITLAGLVPDVDVPIEFVGLRPGEKLHEELFVEEEGILPSLHPKIMIATSIGSDDPELATKIDRLKLLASEVRRQEVIEGIRDIVPSFVPASQTL